MQMVQFYIASIFNSFIFFIDSSLSLHCRDIIHPDKENVDPEIAKSSYSSLFAPLVVEEVLGPSLRFEVPF